MNETLRLAKKAATWATVVATVAWSMGLAAFAAPMAASAASLADGDLIRSDAKGAYAVYYYFGGKRYVFSTQKTFLSWYSEAQLKKTTDGGLVKIIPATDMGAVTIGGNVTYKPGVKLVKVDSDPKTYAVAKNGTLRHVTSEQAAKDLYGANWNKLVNDIPDGFFTNYSVGAAIVGSGDYNRDAEMNAATSIAVDKNLGMATVPTTPTTPVSGTGTLSVSLSPLDAATGKTNPTVLTDSSNDAGGQRAAVLTARLTSSGSEVRVDSLKLNRTGIQTDSDLDAMYLFNGSTMIAQSTSVSKGVATFSKTGGLLTVPANGFVDVTLFVDVNKSTSTGTTVGWRLDGTNVTSTAASVSGTAQGSNWAVVSVSDLGYLDLKDMGTASANTIDPQDGYDVWKFRLDANSQDMLVTKLTLTNVGSTNDTDLQNFSLWYGSQKLGEATQTNKKLMFDLSTMTDGGFKITSGAQRQFSLRADIKSGSTRTFRFGFQESNDVMVKDLNYGVWTVPAADDNDPFTVIQAGGATTINSGTLTVTIATDSPTGNVPVSATNVTLAKWNYKAAGENVKVKTLTTTCNSSDTSLILKNIKLSYKGSGVGSVATNLTCNGTDTEVFSFGNSFSVEAGTTGDLVVSADLNDSSVTAGDSISVSLSQGSSNAQGIASLSSISTSPTSGRLVTVASGSLNVSKNSSLGEYSSTRPMGVTGSANVRLASFVITGGAEPSEISQIVVNDDTTSTNLSSYVTNLRLMHGTTPLGTSISSPSSTTNSFNISPAVVVGIGETYVVDVYADILSSTSSLSTFNADTNGSVAVSSVVASGKNTGSATSYSGTIRGQAGYIASNGMLRVTASASTPVDQQLVLGSTDQTFGKFLFAEESNAEDILVKRIALLDVIITNTSVPFASTGTLRNVKLYNGSTLLGKVDGFNISTITNSTTPLALFDLTGLATGGLVVPKGQSLTLTATADLSPYTDGGSASSTHRFALGATGNFADIDPSVSGVQNSVDAIGLGSGFSISTSGATATSGLVIGVSSGSTQTNILLNTMDAVRTKISFAVSTDAGFASPTSAVGLTSETTIGIFKVSNTANVGNYRANLAQLNFQISTTSISISSAGATLAIYKDSVVPSNQIATTTTAGVSNPNVFYSAFTDAGFTDLEVDAGTSRYVFVTLTASGTTVDSNDSIVANLLGASSGGQPSVLWADGSGNSYTEVNGLPLYGTPVRF